MAFAAWIGLSALMAIFLVSVGALLTHDGWLATPAPHAPVAYGVASQPGSSTVSATGTTSTALANRADPAVMRASEQPRAAVALAESPGALESPAPLDSPAPPAAVPATPADTPPATADQAPSTDEAPPMEPETTLAAVAPVDPEQSAPAAEAPQRAAQPAVRLAPTAVPARQVAPRQTGPSAPAAAQAPAPQPTAAKAAFTPPVPRATQPPKPAFVPPSN